MGFSELPEDSLGFSVKHHIELVVVFSLAREPKNNLVFLGLKPAQSPSKQGSHRV